ncbi:hypothetical protein DF186_14860, partial [Enterococcus hirae]
GFKVADEHVLKINRQLSCADVDANIVIVIFIVITLVERTLIMYFYLIVLFLFIIFVEVWVKRYIKMNVILLGLDFLFI